MIRIVGRLRLLLDGLQHFEHLGLDRHVERRRRLVGDQAATASRQIDIAISARWRMPPENSCGYCL